MRYHDAFHVRRIQKMNIATLFNWLPNPWCAVKQLREENEKLVSMISDPLMTGMKIGNGTLDVGIEGAGPQLMAGMFLGMFEKNPDAKNYIEASFGSRMGPILVTVIHPGCKTPHQLRREAENNLTGALAALKNLDKRFRECVALGLSAAEAYDSYYQEETAAVLETATNP